MISDVTALATCRFAQDAAALILWGASGYLAWFVPPDLAVVLAARLQVWSAAAVAVAVAATAVELPVEAASVGDGWRDALDPDVAAAFLIDTGGGHAWILQAVAAVLLVAACFAPVWTRLVGSAAAAALMLAGLGLTGHAVMREGWIGVANRANAILHVLASGAWLGALVPVLFILPRLVRAEDRPDAALALRRFSRAGHVAVALSLSTGVVGTALVLGRWPIDLRSPYEALLDAKAAAVAGMAVAAVFNRYVLVPRLPSTLPALFRTTLAEVPLGLLAVALVAVFGLLDPRRP